MSVESARASKRRQCRGEVTVYDLGGGERFKAAIEDLGSGGAKLIVDRPMAPGQFVRLMFPRKTESQHRTGRIIVGQVVHSRNEAGKSVVGVAFGWDAGFDENSRPSSTKKAFSSWLGIFSGAARRMRLALARGGRVLLNRGTPLPAALLPSTTAGGGRSRRLQRPGASHIARAPRREFSDRGTRSGEA
jgi:PilZ domain